jgi:hypothetical protein
MRRLVKWIGGTAGGIAAYRFVRRQEASLKASAEPEPESFTTADARAAELREKLAESRAEQPVAEEAPAPEEGRATLDEMRSD